MTHASLFSGIGGFDLAAEWAGWENIFWCEKDKFCQRLLSYYWPKQTAYHDIKTTEFTVWRGRIDVLSGGFPCQPFSQAGQRKGTEDDRYLWPEMLRAIREIQPIWVVGENVHGIVNWSKGMVFEQVQADLEAEGYEVLPVLLPACGIDAPHRRERVWFVAYSTSLRCRMHIFERENLQWYKQACREARTSNNENWFITHPNSTSWESLIKCTRGKQGLQREQIWSDTATVSQESFTANAFSLRCKWRSYKDKSFTPDENFKGYDSWFFRSPWENFPSQPSLCGGDDGLPRELDGLTFPKWRKESLRGYGNAIVPELAFQIFETINEMNKIMQTAG